MSETDEYGYPVATATGIRCGNHPPQETVRHASVEAVGRCFALRFAEQAEEDARGVVQFDQVYRECEGCQTPKGQRCPDSCPVLQAEEAQERYANSY